MPSRIAIIGDRFMLSSAFRAAIVEACGPQHQIRGLDLPWPDQAMAAAGAAPDMDAVSEYQGAPSDVIDFVGDAEIMVTHLAPLSDAMMARMPDLRCVVVSRGGPVNVDLLSARRRGLRVAHVPGRNASAVAEFTIGAILTETRMIRAGHEALRQGEWRGDLYRADRTGRELSEMTVGVVGYGEIGMRVVGLLRAFGCRILVADPYVQLTADDRGAGVEAAALEVLLARSDVVTLHARVTEETTGFIDAAAFARMPAGAILVNTARGPLVDYDALYDALASGHLGGAMIETFAVEPPPPNWPLLKLPNVTLTPHIAGASRRTIAFTAERVAEEVRRYLAGEPAAQPC